LFTADFFISSARRAERKDLSKAKPEADNSNIREIKVKNIKILAFSK